MTMDTVNAPYTLHEFDTRPAMVDALTRVVANTLQSSLDTRGQAVFAVSGGSTPKPLFEALSTQDLDWANIAIPLVDERWVDPGAPGSNASFVAQTLLQNRAAAAQFIGMKTPHATPIEGAMAVEEAYASLPQPFDVVILGLGPDGHTASWFPHANGLGDAIAPDTQRMTAPVRAHRSDVTGEHLDRMTLTLPPIAGAKSLVMMIAGQDKRDALTAAAGQGAVHDMPVRALLQHEASNLDVYWAP